MKCTYWLLQYKLNSALSHGVGGIKVNIHQLDNSFLLRFHLANYSNKMDVIETSNEKPKGFKAVEKTT